MTRLFYPCLFGLPIVFLQHLNFSISPFLPRFMLHAHFFPSIIWTPMVVSHPVVSLRAFCLVAWVFFFFALLDIHLLEGLFAPSFPLSYLSYPLSTAYLVRMHGPTLTPPRFILLSVLHMALSFLRIYCWLFHVLGFFFFLIFISFFHSQRLKTTPSRSPS